MASMTIRNLDDGVMQALEAQAARRGVSAEEEARRVLGAGVEVSAETRPSETAGEILRRIKNETGGFDVELERPDWSSWKTRPIDLGE
jgi:plasmid stability protein